ncbi:MAG: HAD family hydrolase [Parcubacteria group bacterium]|nr:HAD family hydrolase [Parcubacteria group bacterium]
MHRIRNIFFDLDGTLIDVSEKYYRVYMDFVKQEGLKPFFSKEKFLRLKRKGASNSSMFKDKKMLARYESFFLENIERERYLKYDKMFSFSLRVLKKLRKLGFRIFVVTLRRNRKNLFKETERFGFPAAVSILQGSPRVFNGKSDYETKKKLVKRFTHTRDIMVGDTEADMMCGKGLGMITVGVLSGMRQFSCLKKLKPDRIVQDIRSILSTLS